MKISGSLPLSGFAELLALAHPHRRLIVATSILMVAESLIGLAGPWLAGRLADLALGPARAATHSVLLALLAMLAAQGLLRVLTASLSARVTEGILADLRVRVFAHLQALPLRYHHDRQRGDTMALLTYEVSELSAFLTGSLLRLLPLSVSAAGASLLMFRIDPWLAFLAAFLIPIFAIAIRLAWRRVGPVATKLQAANARSFAKAAETFENLHAIKIFTRESDGLRRYARLIGQVRDLRIRQQAQTAAIEVGVQFAAMTLFLAMLWLASNRLAEGTSGPGTLVSFFLYAALLARPISAFSGLYGHAKRAEATLARLRSVLQETAEPVLDHGNPQKLVATGSIALRKVTFGYPGEPPILRSVDLTVGQNEIVAIVGLNGAGKSTLAHLLLRLHEPQDGDISIGGQSITTLPLRQLRQSIALVPQQVQLFNATVAANIAFGRSGASRDAVVAAAVAARADEFIRALPQGYDTIIGDNGVKLSGGQRQKVALARALLKDPPILILDEATAMFDPESEASLIESCRDVLASRAVILITHRPASLRLANRILELRDGRLTERAPPR